MLVSSKAGRDTQALSPAEHVALAGASLEPSEAHR